MLRQTTPKRTTRIRGCITGGDWTQPEWPETGTTVSDGMETKTEGMKVDNVKFREAEFENDILLDTECSYTIVSLAWITKYCRRHNIDLKNVLIRDPDNYETPCANTAEEGSSVQGIGFARIKLKLVTLPTGQSLKWNQGDMLDGGGTMNVELDTYVHVFENMGSPFLLGMPFIQEFTHAWDFSDSQISLKGEAEGREFPIHPVADVPMRPVMVCTKQEVHLNPHSDTCVESYTVGATSFPERVQFHDSADAENWTTTQYADGEKLEYSLEAFETGTRLHREEFEVYGMAGRSIPNREMSEPQVKIRCGELPTVIPAGTPIAFAVQKCRRVPTYR